MKVPPGRPTIAHRFNGGFAFANRVESRKDDRTSVPRRRVLFRPSGACSRLPDLPTVETVGYFLAPLRGFAGTSALERETDQQVCALYALTPEEIKLVEKASK